MLLSSGPDGQAVSLDTHSGKKLSQFKGSKHGASAAALSAGGLVGLQPNSAIDQPGQFGILVCKIDVVWCV